MAVLNPSSRPVILWLYLARRIAAPFGVGLTILLMSLSLERLLRLVDMVASEGAPASRAFILMACLVPHYLTLALPVALFLGILLAMRGLHDRFELAAVQSTGISLRSLIKPVLILSAIVSAVMLLLAGYIEPHARYAYRAEAYNLSASARILVLKSGQFTDVGKNITARAERVTQDGRRLESVFVSDRSNGEATVITAKSARVMRDEATGEVTVVFENGNLIRDRPDAPAQTLSFTEYPRRMETSAEKGYGARGRDEREMTFRELAADGVPGVDNFTGRNKEMSALHARLVQALSVPFLALLALPFALIGEGRTGKAYGMAGGIVTLILYDKILGFGEAASARGELSPLVAQWGPWAVLGIAAWLMIAWKMPERLKSSPLGERPS